MLKSFDTFGSGSGSGSGSTTLLLRYGPPGSGSGNAEKDPREEIIPQKENKYISGFVKSFEA